MTLYRATKDGDVPLSAEEEVELLAQWAEPVPQEIPQIISMRQARLCLHQNNLLDAVNTAIAASDAETQLTWEYAQEVNRKAPYISVIGSEISLTDAQIDALFIQAATL